MSRIWVIRPQPGCGDSVAAARALGLVAEPLPLSRISGREWQAPEADAFDGLLLGSANALRHAGDAIGAYAGKRAWCVGEATADAARGAGLEIADVGVGGLQTVLDNCPAPLHLLRLAGEEHTKLEVPAGIRITTRIVYGSQSVPLPEDAAQAIADGGLVLLHSAAAAAHFAEEYDRLGVPRSAVSLAALGPRIAAAAGEGWARLRWAEQPRDAALLALAREMCHEAPAREI